MDLFVRVFEGIPGGWLSEVVRLGYLEVSSEIVGEIFI